MLIKSLIRYGISTTDLVGRFNIEEISQCSLPGSVKRVPPANRVRFIGLQFDADVVAMNDCRLRLTLLTVVNHLLIRITDFLLKLIYLRVVAITDLYHG